MVEQVYGRAAPAGDSALVTADTPPHERLKRSLSALQTAVVVACKSVVPATTHQARESRHQLLQLAENGARTLFDAGQVRSEVDAIHATATGGDGAAGGATPWMRKRRTGDVAQEQRLAMRRRVGVVRNPFRRKNDAERRVGIENVLVIPAVTDRLRRASDKRVRFPAGVACPHALIAPPPPPTVCSSGICWRRSPPTWLRPWRSPLFASPCGAACPRYQRSVRALPLSGQRRL